MKPCRLFRVLGLDYWRARIREYCTLNINVARQLCTGSYWSELTISVCGVLSECMEQVRHGMRIAELRAEA